MDISFTTTAMSRPDILERTYTSFAKKLKDIKLSNLKLFINIDPLPDPKKRKQCIDIAKSFFKEVEVRTPDCPNFTAAVNWCWESATTEYIFHLEDDWILEKPVSIKDMLSYFKDPKIKQVVIRAYEYRYKKLCLSPSLIHNSIYKRFAGNLNIEMNPEVQLRKPDINKKMIICMPKQVVLKDIGREWLKKSSFKKKDMKASFNKWIEK